MIRTSSKEGRPLLFAKPGSVTVGDKVYLAGNPKGLEGTVSTGIVSAVRDDGRLIQIDAPISPGSSGGPVVNDRGEVIGIATKSLVQGQNLNFAAGLLGGPDVRTVDGPVFDVGVTALSSLERAFLKGPVKRVRTDTMHGYGIPNRQNRGAASQSKDETFDENGMSLVSQTRTFNIEEQSWEDGTDCSYEYHDSRVRSRISCRMSLAERTAESYTCDKGRVVGTDEALKERR